MNLKNVVLGIAIMILTIFVAVYGISLIYEAPEYTDYCEEFRTAEVINNSERCVEVGGSWDGNILKPAEGTQGYCDRNFSCRQEYEEVSEKYSRNIFLIAVPLGILVIVLGAVLFGLEAVGAGLMGGGVGIILYGVGGFWRFADDWLKFSISLLGLIILIWFSYRFNGKGFKWQKKKR
jgi:hypothetical protein